MYVLLSSTTLLCAALTPCFLRMTCHLMQDVLDEKLAAERKAVASLQAQAAAARAALEAEQALVSQLKEEASASSAAAQQLMALEQQVRRCAVLCCAVQLLCVGSLAVGIKPTACVYTPHRCMCNCCACGQVINQAHCARVQQSHCPPSAFCSPCCGVLWRAVCHRSVRLPSVLLSWRRVPCLLRSVWLRP